MRYFDRGDGFLAYPQELPPRRQRSVHHNHSQTAEIEV